jgi:hypothetical protein
MGFVDPTHEKKPTIILQLCLEGSTGAGLIEEFSQSQVDLHVLSSCFEACSFYKFIKLIICSILFFFACRSWGYR